MRLGTADIEAAREAGRRLVRLAPALSAASLETRGLEYAEAICGVPAASGYKIVREPPSRSAVSRA